MGTRSTRASGYVGAIAVKAVSAVVMGLVGAIVTRAFGLRDDWKSIAVGSLVFGGYVLVDLIRGRVLSIRDDVGKRYLREKAGIEAALGNLQACKEELHSAFRASREVRLLLQIGRREFGDGEQSFFYSLAKDMGAAAPHVRVLRASADSPFLSARRARKRRGSDVEEWRTEMHSLQERIRLLSDTFGVRIEDREHGEPFLWRIFIFDDVAYVSGYLYSRDNDRTAVVHKLARGESSLFSVFDKYFEYLWKKYDPEGKDKRPDEWWEDF